MVGAYLVTPGSKDFMLCMATPDGIIALQGMVLQVLGNLYGLPSSGRNFCETIQHPTSNLLALVTVVALLRQR